MAQDDLKYSQQKENFISLDIEMNQPEDPIGIKSPIIQIGAVVANLRTGEILEEYNQYVDVIEPITPYITKLTKIDDALLFNEGVTLKEAYEGLAPLKEKYDCFPNPITWGGGDSQELRDQLYKLFPEAGAWVFGRRWIDAKTVFQMYSFSKNMKVQAGLAKAMTRLGLAFSGTKHNALDDAKNTVFILRRLLELMGMQNLP